MNKILFLGLTEKSRMDSTLLIASPSSAMFNTWVDHACTWKKTVCEFFASAEFDLFGLKWKGYRNCFYLAKPFPFDQIRFGKRLCIVNSQHQNKWHLINNYCFFLSHSLFFQWTTSSAFVEITGRAILSICWNTFASIWRWGRVFESHIAETCAQIGWSIWHRNANNIYIIAVLSWVAAGNIVWFVPLSFVLVIAWHETCYFQAE